MVRGHRTVVIDRHGEIECDLSSERSTREAVPELLAKCCGGDVLVRSAAVFDQASLEDPFGCHIAARF